MFWLVFFLWVGFTVLGELLRPKPKFGAPNPSSIGEFTVPTAEAGRAIPVVFGSAKLQGPNVVWYGDLVVSPIKENVKTGLFSSKTITKGYRYYLGQQLVLCHGPLDEVTDIRFDDRTTPPVAIVVKPSTNTFTFTHGGPTIYTATVTPGTYASFEALAAEIENAMNAGDGTTGNHVVYGFEVRGAQTRVSYAVELDNGTIDDQATTIAAGIYATGTALASAVAAAITAKEVSLGGGARIGVTGTYDGARFRFIGRALVSGLKLWHIKDPVPGSWGVSSLPVFGFAPQEDVLSSVGFPAMIVSPYAHQPFRFVFASTGGTGPFPHTLYGSQGTKVLSTCGMPPSTVTGRNIEATYNVAADGMTVTSVADKTTFKIRNPAMFGGEEREGGIVGTFDVYKGTQTQTPDSYLQSVLGVALPAYLGIAYAVAARVYVGTSAYLKNISFLVRRTPNGLGLVGGAENIGGDANPACVVYEILTNATWGCGVPVGLIDAPSFIAAAQVLSAEGLGISMVFDVQARASDLLGEVLRHVDGVVYADPSTGKMRITLARPGYAIQDLMPLDASMVDKVRVARPSWEETRNVVKIRYIDRTQNYTERIAQAQDLANVQARAGDVSEEEFDFRGLGTAAAAQKTAARVLRTVSYPLAAVEFEASRRAWRLRPGDLFRLTWPPMGIANMPCRVTRVRTGEPREGRVLVDAVEDIFGIGWTAYSNPASSSWVDPVGAPGDMEAAALVEVPFAMVPGPDRLAMALAAGGSPRAEGVEVWSDVTTQNYALSHRGVLTPSGTLFGGAGSGSIGYGETEIVVVPGNLMPQDIPSAADFAGGGAVLLIDAEFIAWQYFGVNADGTYTFSGLVRGVMDTTPALHAGGARVWFVTDGATPVRDAPYTADATVRAKMLAFNAVGISKLENAVEASVVLASRAIRPYVPSAFTINGLSYPSVISGAFVMVWSLRNRLGTWTYDNAGATADLEAGATFTIRLYGDAGTLLRTYSGLTTTTQTWATEAADSGGALNLRVRVEVEATAAAGVSYQIINFTTVRVVSEAPGEARMGSDRRRWDRQLGPGRRRAQWATN